MTFSTLSFLLCFLPLLMLLYFLIPKRCIGARNGVLLVFSLLFYAWGEPKYVFLIVLCVGTTFALSFAVLKRNILALILSVFINLLPLLLYKYADFILLNFCSITGASIKPLGLVMPIGISFYTFQVLTYIIDLYRGKVRLQHNPAYLLLYVFFFPQLIAGPIVRYSDVEEEIHKRTSTWEDFSYGGNRFIIGLAKKVLLANQAGYIATTIQSLDASRTGAALMWVSVLSYGVQIYFDFSGYSDMAIGLGRIFGFHLLENFNKPYAARSITDFWRRWHISLSTFFRDYVYIPMGGSHVRVFRHILNLFVVWFLTGLWHGAYWNYALWGVYYFVLLVLEKYLYGKSLNKLPVIASRCIILLLVMFGWAIFQYESNSLKDIINYLARLVGFFPAQNPTSLHALALEGSLIVTCVGLVLSISQIPAFIRRFRQRHEVSFSIFRGIILLLLMILSILFIVGGSFNPFIYFRF